MMKSLGSVILIFLFVLGSKPTQAENEISAKAVVSSLNAALLEAMKTAQTQSYQARYQQLDPVIRQSHDLERIAKFSVGKHWNTMSEQQQAAFIEKFSTYSVATYVNRFNGYGGEVFTTLSETSLPRGKALVKASLESPEYGIVNFEYICDTKNRQWKIINIMADGVSDLALKRAHYTDLIEKKGIDALLAELHEKIIGYQKN